MDNKIKNNKFRYWLGGCVAALLPVSLGLWFAAIPVIVGGDKSCNIHTNNVTMICDFYRSFGSVFYQVFCAPIYLSLIFIAPIIAISCVQNLLKETEVFWIDIIQVSISQSTKANLWTAVIYNGGLFFYIFYLPLISNSLNGIGIIFVLLTLIIIIQTLLWMLITMPLSLICAIIFGLIIRPHNKSSL